MTLVLLDIPFKNGSMDIVLDEGLVIGDRVASLLDLALDAGGDEY